MIRCIMCDGPVEDKWRNWIDPGAIRERRFWLCNFHHQPIRDGEAWIERDDHGRYFLRFKQSQPVTRFLL